MNTVEKAGGSSIRSASIKEAGVEEIGDDLRRKLSKGTDERLGEILVRQGSLTTEQADEVVAYQRENALSFGDAAKQMGVLDEQMLKTALADQFGYRWVPSDSDELSKELVAAYKPDSSYAEYMRSLRSELMVGVSATAPFVLAGLSTMRGDGRTHFISNLAIVFAQLGKRTLLIDADLRHPRVHTLFGMENRCGLSILLSGRKCKKALRPVPHFPGLGVLPSGPVPPNPQELVSGDHMAALLKSAKRRYDVILIDTPPTSGSSDGENIARMAQNAVLVAKKHRTSYRRFTQLTGRLKKREVRLAGTVLIP